MKRLIGFLSVVFLVAAISFAQSTTSASMPANCPMNHGDKGAAMKCCAGKDGAKCCGGDCAKMCQEGDKAKMCTKDGCSKKCCKMAAGKSCCDHEAAKPAETTPKM